MKRVAALAVLPAIALTGPSAAADSFEPVRITVNIAPVARLHRALAVKVSVAADAGAFDGLDAPVRVRVKLAGQCGGEFQHTPGVVLLDRRLAPQPTPGLGYRGNAKGRGRPNAYGIRTVCVFIEQEGDNRQFATSTDVMVDVSRRCTVAANRMDRARRSLRLARAKLRHARGSGERARLVRLIAAKLRTTRKLERAARRTCGRGVPL